MADYDLSGFEAWLEKNRTVVEGLNVYRRLKQGFSFRIFELDDASEVAAHFGQYQLSITDMQRFWPKYLAKGLEYCRIISDRQINIPDKLRLIDLSEEHGHIFHNAAVLCLENLTTDRDPAVNSYENNLKDLWLGQLRFFDRGDSRRRQALIDYLRSHTVLGKVIRSRPTRFHDRPSLLKMHPAFWGLFLFSRTHRADNLHFVVNPGSADDKWRQTLTGWNEANAGQKAHYITGFLDEIKMNSGHYPVYEPLPRDFADPRVAPRGVYLHRSKAHGRDDFLVVNTPDSKPAVFCTKGVGADPDRIMNAIKRQRGDTGFERFWTAGPPGPETGQTPLPFEYQFTQGASGWSVLGFCIDIGNVGEHLGRDYHNFAAMYDFVVRWRTAAGAQDRINSLAGTIIDWLPRVFVEPYACIEISRHYQENLRTPIGQKNML